MMQLRRFLRLANSLLLLFGMLVVIIPRAYAGEPNAPDWALQAAQLTVPPFDRDVKAYTLLREDTISVDKHGRAVVYHREVRKILRPQGKPLAQVVVSFDAHSKVDFLRVWTIEPDGHVYEVKNRDVVEAGDFEQDVLFADDRVKIATAIAADPGSVVAFEYQRKLEPYLTTDVFDLQEENLPSLQQRITLQLPPNAEYNVAWKYLAPITPKEISANTWQWEIHPMPAVKSEPMSPARRVLHARMLLSYFSSGLPAQAGEWKDVGRWFQQLAAGRPDATPEIAAKAVALTTGTTDFMGKLLDITGYMQDQIRYIAIEVGVGGWQPHPASDVYRNRYGDCKDKATLLIAMLHAVGIPAYYVLVDSDRGFVTPNFPSQCSDHMITAIELPKGLEDPRLESVVTSKDGRRLLIFDPTEQELPIGQLENPLQGSYGLLIDGANTQLLQLPEVNPVQSTVRRSGHFQLTVDGALEGSLDENFSGPDASYARYLFGSGDMKEERVVVENSMRNAQAGLTLQSFQIQNATDRNQDLTLHCKLEASHYARQAGAFLLVRPRVAGSDTKTIDLDHPRLYPVQFDGLDTQTEDYTIDLPVGYAAVDIPDPVKLDVGFATYSSKTEVAKGQIHFVREMRVQQLEIPAEQYAKFAKFMQEVGNDENDPVFLKKTN